MGMRMSQKGSVHSFIIEANLKRVSGYITLFRLASGKRQKYARELRGEP